MTRRDWWAGALVALLILLFSGMVALAEDLTVVWDAPTTNTDGTALQDLASYKVYRNGELAGSTTDTTYTDTGLLDGTWCFTVTAVDESGNESAPSNEACRTIDTLLPGPPQNLRFN